jgi:uncharacterized protein (DUF3084 family)
MTEQHEPSREAEELNDLVERQAQLDKQTQEFQTWSEQLRTDLTSQEKTLASKLANLERLTKQSIATQHALEEREKDLEAQVFQVLESQEQALEETSQQFMQQVSELDAKQSALEALETNLQAHQTALGDKEEALERLEEMLRQKQGTLETAQKKLEKRRKKLDAKEIDLENEKAS